MSAWIEMVSDADADAEDLAASGAAGDADAGDLLSVTGLDTTLTLGAVVDNGDGTFDYTPPSGFSGIDSFVYTASDTSGATDTAVVTISVGPVNDPPVAVDAEVHVHGHGRSVALTVGVADLVLEGVDAV